MGIATTRPLTVFDQHVRDDLDSTLASREFSEPIRYKPAGNPWAEVLAFVEDQKEETIGAEGVTRIHPIFITVSKTDVPQIVEREDVVEYQSREYTVIRVESQDAAGFRLYCDR